MELEEGIEVRKSKWFKYRLVYKYKNPDGTINWFNALTGGSWGNLVLVIAVVAFLVALVLIYKRDVMTLIEFYNSTCIPLKQQAISTVDYAIPVPR